MRTMERGNPEIQIPHLTPGHMSFRQTTLLHFKTHTHKVEIITWKSYMMIKVGLGHSVPQIEVNL